MLLSLKLRLCDWSISWGWEGWERAAFFFSFMCCVWSRNLELKPTSGRGHQRNTTVLETIVVFHNSNSEIFITRNSTSNAQISTILHDFQTFTTQKYETILYLFKTYPSQHAFIQDDSEICLVLVKKRRRRDRLHKYFLLRLFIGDWTIKMTLFSCYG